MADSKSVFDTNKKYLHKSNTYKNVYIYELSNGRLTYQARLTKYKWSAYYGDERQAAKAVDIKLIENRQEPINILKKKH